MPKQGTAVGYYDVLIAAWNSSTQPPTGVVGTGLTAQMTLEQKIAAVNGWGIPRRLPALVTSTDLLNCIVATDFSSLGVNGLAQLQIIVTTPMVNISIGTQIRAMLANLFSGKATTLANITALAAPFDNAVIEWVTTPISDGGAGLGGLLTQIDCSAAGLH